MGQRPTFGLKRGLKWDSAPQFMKMYYEKD